MIKQVLTIYIFGILLVLPTQNPVMGENAIIWSDDFNDGDYDGWTISGHYFPLVGSWRDTTGEVSVESKVLRIAGTKVFRNMTFATHASTQVYGSWSFDLDLKSVYGSSNHTHVYFIDARPVEDIPDFGPSFCCYDIAVISYPSDDPPDYAKEANDLSPAFFLIKRPGVKIMDYYQVDAIAGWYHFDITRDESGEFKVYINNTLRMQATDNTWQISRSFYFGAEAGTGMGIDNVVVRDDIINPTNDGVLSSSFVLTAFMITALIVRRKRKIPSGI
ncbi:MAG: hypothetical protein ACXAD7_10225 [Candidatus Kariarchaeaceae archaeon]